MQVAIIVTSCTYRERDNWDKAPADILECPPINSTEFKAILEITLRDSLSNGLLVAGRQILGLGRFSKGTNLKYVFDLQEVGDSKEGAQLGPSIRIMPRPYGELVLRLARIKQALQTWAGRKLGTEYPRDLSPLLAASLRWTKSEGITMASGVVRSIMMS